MTAHDKQQMVIAMSGEHDGDVVSAYLQLAGAKICAVAYPYNPEITSVPERYEMLQVEAAVYLLNKRGAEGETSHAENGVSRSYENAGLPDSILRLITPMAGVTR